MSVGAFLQGFSTAFSDQQRRLDAVEMASAFDSMLDRVGEIEPAPMGPQEAAAPGSGSKLFDLIDRVEGAGNYDTLFAHSQRPGGRFEGVRPSRMTLDELSRFQSVGGEYGQWVKSRLGEMGHEARVATPIGRHQIVGTTLRRTAREMGLPGDTVFDASVQDRMATHLARQRLASPRTPAGDRAALRAEWEGFKHVPDAQLDAAIVDFRQSHM